MSKQFDALLDFWAKNNMNVLLSGAAGFGKTAAITQCFERNGLRWKYFSAATMDPWVDFIGVPKEMVDEHGQKYLGLVRPKEFENDEYDALFFDEFSRANKKVRNAVMELIQFKSINGHKFHNLKMVWAAINPYDEEDTYDVERLDPAQIDRFHVLYDVPSVPDRDYFINTYGTVVGKAALEWWNAIPEKARKGVSARRLQYILDCYLAGGDIRHLVHKDTNPSKLLDVIQSGPLMEKLRDIIARKDNSELCSFVKKDNNFEVAVTMMRHNPKTIKTILPCVDEERLMRLVHDVPAVKVFVMAPENIKDYSGMLSATVRAGTLNAKDESQIRSVLTKNDSTSLQVEFFVPTPQLALATPAEVALQAHSWCTSLQRADEHVIIVAYDYLAMNLQEPQSIAEALSLIFVLYRIIEQSKDTVLATKCVKIIPMLNFLIDFLDRNNLNVNESSVRMAMAKGPFKLMSKTKVQRYLDMHHESLIVKPRVL
jgi:hypothetical protein